MGVDATYFVLGQHWKDHFSKRAKEADGSISVGQLRKWIDDPKPMGLPKDAQNMVIMIYAAQTSQTIYNHGGPHDATLSNLPDSCELRKDKLPDQSDWEVALERAGSMFGVAGMRLLSAGNVTTLAKDCKQKASNAQRTCQTYVQQLKQSLADLELPADECDRMKTAVATQVLVDKLCVSDAGDVVSILANANIETSETAMGECISKSAELEGNLDTAGWRTFELIGKLPAKHQATATKILTELKGAIASDEHATELAPALKSAQAQAMRLLEKMVEVSPPTGPPVVSPPGVEPPENSEKRIFDQGSEQELDLQTAKELLAGLDSKLTPKQSVRINLSWIIEEGGDA